MISKSGCDQSAPIPSNNYLIFKIKQLFNLARQSLCILQQQKRMQVDQNSFQCHVCSQNCQQFTFLLCNHIVCGSCVQNIIETNNKFSYAACPCGSVTYFDSEFPQRQGQESIHFSHQNISQHAPFEQLSAVSGQKPQSHQQKQLLDTKENSRVNNNQTSQLREGRTNFNIDFHSGSSPNNLHALQVSEVLSLHKSESGSGIESLIDTKRQKPSPNRQRCLNSKKAVESMRKRSHNPHNYNSQSSCQNNNSNELLEDESLLIEDSYHQKSPNYRNEFTKPTTNIGIDSSPKNEIREINEFNVHSIEEETKKINRALNPRKSVEAVKQHPNCQSQPNQKPLCSEIYDENRRPGTQHGGFQKELDFIAVVFTKQMQELEEGFESIVKTLKQKYHHVQEQLKTLYIEQIFTSSSLQSNIPTMVKKRYRAEVGDRISQIKDQLFLFTKNLTQSSVSSHIKVSPFTTLDELTDTNKSCNDRFYDKLSSISRKLGSLPSYQKSRNYGFNDRDQEWGSRKPFTEDQIDKGVLQDQEGSIQEAENSKRIQTENLHTHIKKCRRSENDLQQRKTVAHSGYVKRPRKLYENQESESGTHYESTNDQRYSVDNAYSSKKPRTISRQHSHKCVKQIEIKKPTKQDGAEESPEEVTRKHLIYYSPPVPYCLKHYQKREKQAKNYLSYIQKLCHEKKMKNNRELFKKSKHGNHGSQHHFKLRD